MGALGAVVRMLKGTSKPKALVQGFKLLEKLSPDASQDQRARQLISQWLMSRHLDFRRIALKLAAELPKAAIQDCDELRGALQDVAAGDWPRLGQDAKGIL